MVVVVAMVAVVVVIDREEEEMVEVVGEVAHHRCLHKDMMHT